LVENRDSFHTPLVFNAPARGSPLEYCRSVWCCKTRMIGYRMVTKFDNVFTSFDTIHERDRQTDGQTDTAQCTVHSVVGQKPMTLQTATSVIL